MAVQTIFPSIFHSEYGSVVPFLSFLMSSVLPKQTCQYGQVKCSDYSIMECMKFTCIYNYSCFIFPSMEQKINSTKWNGADDLQRILLHHPSLPELNKIVFLHCRGDTPKYLLVARQALWYFNVDEYVFGEIYLVPWAVGRWLTIL